MRTLTRDVALVTWAQGEVGKPYVWGETDCASLVRRGHEIFGVTHDLPGWTTKRGALRALSQVGGVEAYLVAVATEIERSFLQQADVAVLPTEEHPRLLLYVGPSFLTSLPDRGVYLVDRRALPEDARLWRVNGR